VAATALFAMAAAQVPSSDTPTEFAEAPPVDEGAALPADPIKPLVYARCDKCHGLRWIANSGGSEQGWTERIVRMNRAGAMIPADEIPALAAYLARALPERPRPPQPQRRGLPAVDP
jgi:hypothetical protein